MAESTKPGPGVNWDYARERRSAGRLADPGSIPGASTGQGACLTRDQRVSKLHVALVSRELASGDVRSSGPPHGACSRGTA